MREIEKWIWLPKDKYPNWQTTKYCGFDKNNESYCVAYFRRNYKFDKKIAKAQLRFSGDTEFVLYCNDKFTATGPASPGGDFMKDEKSQPIHYATETEIYPDSENLNFFARVKLMPVGLNEYSKGYGGFMLTAHITFDDGSKSVITTDKSWETAVDGAFSEPYYYDGSICADEYSSAEEITNLWHTETSPLPPRSEETIFCEKITFAPGEEKETEVLFDKIYAGFIGLSVKTEGRTEVTVECFETDEKGSSESFVFDKNTEYRGLQLHSVGGYRISVKNLSDKPVVLQPYIITTFYPVAICTKTTTSDDNLNKVFDVCRHTLKYCRQMMHLDSPRHSEPLACTGDYYIESLMTAFSFGDMRLAEFDVRRTAERLRYNDGKLFHTSFSLIWVLMLYDVYNFTGNKDILKDCEDGLSALLARFERYIGENGLIETPDDYMFVDWIYIDGISMHHPPKALGQTCLNMFYYSALEKAAEIYSIISEEAMSVKCRNKAENIKKAINTHLYDEEKQMYFEGLNTPTPENLLGKFMPQNTDKRYYLKHSNILAAYTGICGKQKAQNLIDRIMNDEIVGEYQPYFAHFLFEAIFRNEMTEKYTLKLAERWKKPVQECDKGLVEGFIAPEPTYSFDHSHAWGGSPLYSVPKALLGFEMIKPGFEKISLKPNLMGLHKAKVEVPTPYGIISCIMEEGKEPIVSVPNEIKVN